MKNRYTDAASPALVCRTYGRLPTYWMSAVVLAFCWIGQLNVIASVPYAGGLPFVEGFESGGLDSLGAAWEFAAENGGIVEVTDQDEPQAGSYHLRMSGTSYSDSEAAILHLDLTGQSCVALEFDFKRVSGSGGAYLSIRPDSDTPWKRVIYLYDYDQSYYQTLSFDLDALLEEGWTYGGDFQIRWHITGNFAFAFDQIRVSENCNPLGPRVVALDPNSLGGEVASFDSVTIEFDSSVDLESLSSGDIALENPQGYTITVLSVEPLPGSKNSLFSIQFPVQTIRGTYHLTLPRDIRDSSGNFMNQDQDPLNGEQDDGFTADLSFNAVKWSSQDADAGLFTEDFESWPPPSHHWAFSVSGDGNLSLMGIPHSGKGALHSQFVGKGNHAAWFRWDASALLDRDDVFLTFWAKAPSNFLRSLDVRVREHAATFGSQELSQSLQTEYQLFQIDLDSLVSNSGLQFTDDFEFGFFEKYEPLTDTKPVIEGFYLDDIRVTAGPPALLVESDLDRIPENGGKALRRITVSRINTQDLTEELTVALRVSDEGIALPEAVVIPADDYTVTFFLDSNENVLSGTTQVTIEAEAQAFLPGSLTLDVIESAPPTLEIEFPETTLFEADAGRVLVGRIFRNYELDSSLIVTFTTFPEQQLFTSAKVTIPAGESSAPFSFAAINDGEIDGPQEIAVTALAEGFTAATASLSILDDDSAENRMIGGRLSGVLKKAQYRVTSDILVNLDQELSIEPGATLLFEEGMNFTIAGSLNAIGTEGEEIVFTSAAGEPRPGDWYGVEVRSSGTNHTTLERVEIAFAEIGMRAEENDSHVALIGSRIHHNQGHGIGVWAHPDDHIGRDDVQIVSNLVHSNGGHGISLSSYGSGCDPSSNRALVSNNEVFDNSESGINLSAGASSFLGCIFGSGSGSVGVEVSGNIIRNNKDGIALSASSGYTHSGWISSVIQNNLIASNSENGCRISAGRRSLITSSIINNTILGNGASGLTHNQADFSLQNNIIVENVIGVRANAAFEPKADKVRFNNVFGNPEADWVNYTEEFGNPITVNLNGTPADVFMNIGTDPMFCSDEDSHLTSESPLVNAGAFDGAPEVDLEGDPRNGPIDIGCDEIPHPNELSITAAGDQLTIEWEGFNDLYQLQSRPSLTFPWEDLGPLTDETAVTVSPGGEATFFRVLGIKLCAPSQTVTPRTPRFTPGQ